jgi:hypothetical protein
MIFLDHDEYLVAEALLLKGIKIPESANLYGGTVYPLQSVDDKSVCYVYELERIVQTKNRIFISLHPDYHLKKILKRNQDGRDGSRWNCSFLLHIKNEPEFQNRHC